MPLEAPSEPWQHMSLDFLTGLPHSGHEQYDAILVVTDRFTKSIVAIPCHKTINAEQTAWLLINHVYQYHGAWHTITSDRGPQFTSAVFSHIFSRLGVDCHFSTAHHPESNGQSEIYVEAVTNALKSSLVHHSEDWADLLPFINFALNSTVHDATRVSPFFATTCREPRQFADLTNPVHITAQPLSRTEQTDLRQAINLMVHDAIERARIRYASIIDLRRTPPPHLKPGDMVLVRADALLTPEERDRQPPKLRHDRVGPYKIKRRIRENAYELELPPHSRAHAVINASYLWPYVVYPDPFRTQEPPPVVTTPTGDYYTVESILDHRHAAQGLEFKVKWSGYSIDHASWVPQHDFLAPDLVDHNWLTLKNTKDPKPKHRPQRKRTKLNKLQV